MGSTVAEGANAGESADTFESPSGAVAQLAERLHGMQEVVGSSPISSTDPLHSFHRVWRSIGFTLAGFVAGEGWFIAKRRTERFVRNGSTRFSFVFGVTVARRDRPLLGALTAFLGAGTIRDKPARVSHHQPLSEFTIASMRAHRTATIPFAERYLLPCHKREQFEAWVEAIAEYERTRPSQYGRGRSTCTIPGCEKPVRGRKLCRSHYYRVTGY